MRFLAGNCFFSSLVLYFKGSCSFPLFPKGNTMTKTRIKTGSRTGGGNSDRSDTREY